MVEEVLARYHQQVIAAAALTECLGNLLTSVKWTQDVLLWTQLDQQVWGHPARLLGICLREDPVGGQPEMLDGQLVPRVETSWGGGIMGCPWQLSGQGQEAAGRGDSALLVKCTAVSRRVGSTDCVMRCLCTQPFKSHEPGRGVLWRPPDGTVAFTPGMQQPRVSWGGQWGGGGQRAHSVTVGAVGDF